MKIEGYEVYCTNYPHPDINHGQHTNGPARVWVKVSGEWIDTESHKLHCVRNELRKNGVKRIVNGTWDGR